MIQACIRWGLLALLAGCLFLPASEAYANQESNELQRLLDQAAPGDTVMLPPGHYQGPIVINKPLSLRAELKGEAVLTNNSEDHALRIEADGVSVTGLVIRDSAVKDQPTILVTGNRTVLEDLQIETGANGIEARDANDGIVKDSVIFWVPEDIRMADKGNGIDLFNAHKWRMTGNTIQDVHDGIYMESSDDAIVSYNTIERSRYGIHCMYTKRTVIEHNAGNLNVTGAMVMTAQQVSVSGNTFAKQSENVNSQGILLYDAHETLVENNTVDGNRVGLYVEESTGNRLENNRISYNFIGIQLLEASGNTITANQFLGNVADAQARGSEINKLSGNYWDSFRGIDADGDGKSDISYAINPFFQGLTQKRPAFQLFFQSPGIVFLEGLYQTDKNLWATDSAPVMAPAADHSPSKQSGSAAATGLTGLILLGCTGVLYLLLRRRGT